MKNETKTTLKEIFVTTGKKAPEIILRFGIETAANLLLNIAFSKAFSKTMPADIKIPDAITPAEIKPDSRAKITRAPHLNRGGIRNLSGNRHASPAKIQQALELGIELKDHQTFVPPYWTGKNLAESNG